MKVIGVIPARLGSTRIPAKMIADIDGRPLIEHTYENAKKADVLDDLIVATDSKEIIETVESFGGKAVMTSPENRTGTDRVSEAVRDIECDFVVNIQGDEAFVAPEIVALAVKVLEGDPEAVMGTVASPITSKEEYLDRNVVKVVLDINRRALYFTRAPVPHSKSCEMMKGSPYYRHIGIYSYTREFLMIYSRLTPSILEETESLEQLRALENGYIISVGLTDKASLKIDTLNDLRRARKRRS